jgi:hypothetical protein
MPSRAVSLPFSDCPGSGTAAIGPISCRFRGRSLGGVIGRGAFGQADLAYFVYSKQVLIAR